MRILRPRGAGSGSITNLGTPTAPVLQQPTSTTKTPVVMTPKPQAPVPPVIQAPKPYVLTQYQSPVAEGGAPPVSPVVTNPPPPVAPAGPIATGSTGTATADGGVTPPVVTSPVNEWQKWAISWHDQAKVDYGTFLKRFPEFDKFTKSSSGWATATPAERKRATDLYNAYLRSLPKYGLSGQTIENRRRFFNPEGLTTSSTSSTSGVL